MFSPCHNNKNNKNKKNPHQNPEFDTEDQVLSQLKLGLTRLLLSRVLLKIDCDLIKRACGIFLSFLCNFVVYLSAFIDEQSCQICFYKFYCQTQIFLGRGATFICRFFYVFACLRVCPRQNLVHEIAAWK